MSHKCFRVQRLGLDVLICGAISRPFLRRLKDIGIEIIQGISGHPEAILEAYLQGNIYDSRFLMPGFKVEGREKAKRKIKKEV
ncbi:MAG: NifB/NifX family molybdenum-iron cluster-binding protein [Pseudomonadota bacterium]